MNAESTAVTAASAESTRLDQHPVAVGRGRRGAARVRGRPPARPDSVAHTPVLC